MKIGILQPGYLPWLGFFEQMYKSDVFVIYDDVQYDKDGWRNRNRIKTPKGAQWLTVPVHVKFKDKQFIKDVKIDNAINWMKRHLFSIRQNYAKSLWHEKYIDIFEEAYSKKWDYLIDIDMFFINKIKDCLGIKDKKLIMSSSLNIKGDRLDKIITICRTFKIDSFYEGSAGKNYIDENYFNKNGIKVKYQDYKHPEYNQLYGEFIPYLSIVDLLFNHGDESLSILTGNISKER
jgi:hypothetical protein